MEVISIKPECIKLLEENIGGKFHNTGNGNDFMHMIPKAQATKTKIQSWGHIKLKIFCITKKTICRVKKQPMECKKLFANHVSSKGFIFNTYPEHLKLNSKRKKKRITQFAKDLNRHFFKGDIKMINGFVKKCLIPPAIRGMQIETKQ